MWGGISVDTKHIERTQETNQTAVLTWLSVYIYGALIALKLCGPLTEFREEKREKYYS
jgi:hypothetical protein